MSTTRKHLMSERTAIAVAAALTVAMLLFLFGPLGGLAASAGMFAFIG